MVPTTRETTAEEAAMAGRKNSKRSTAGARPYFEEPEEERNTELARLLGFDPMVALERLEAWLSANDEETPRRDAIEVAMIAVTNACSMYGPEHLAARRWHDELRSLDDRATRALTAASVRERENAYVCGRATGHALAVRGRELESTRALRVALEALRPLIEHARARIPRYRDDFLPTVGAPGRPTLGVLKSVEATLAQGGFSTREIACIISDSAARGRSSAERRAHRDRIRKRTAGRPKKLRKQFTG